MIPVERIRLLNLEAQIGTETGIEIGVFGLESTFQFTGLAAQRAYAYLKDVTPAITAPTPSPILNGLVSFAINNEVFNIAEIEWIDLATDFGNGTTGIEMRISSDAEGITRQFVAEQAEVAYNTLVSLAVNQDAVLTA